MRVHAGFIRAFYRPGFLAVSTRMSTSFLSICGFSPEMGFLIKALLTISICDIFSCLSGGKRRLRMGRHGKVAESGARSSAG